MRSHARCLKVQAWNQFLETLGLNDFPAPHAGFVAGPGTQPRSPGSLPTAWTARPVLSSVSRDPREHWHFSKSAGNFAVFCLEWFTFFHLIPTLKNSSFLFSPSCPSKMYRICRCDGTHSHTCFSWSNSSKFVLDVCFTLVPLIPKVTLNRFFCLTFVWNTLSPFICEDMRF